MKPQAKGLLELIPDGHDAQSKEPAMDACMGLLGNTQSYAEKHELSWLMDAEESASF